MKIYLRISPEEIMEIKVNVNDKSTTILSQIKNQVVARLEEKKISQEQLNIFVGGVLLTDDISLTNEQNNNRALLQLKTSNDIATLEMLTHQQVAFYKAIEALDLSPNPSIKIKSTSPLIVWSKDRSNNMLEDIFGEKYDIKYLRALSKALDELGITSVREQTPRGGSELRIDYPTQVLSDDFAEKLKASYTEELSKFESSLFYVSDPGMLGVSAIGVAMAVVFAIVAGLLAATGIGGVLFGLSAAACIGLSLFYVYRGIKSGKAGGSGDSLSPENDPERSVEIKNVTDFRETKKPSYLGKVVGNGPPVPNVSTAPKNKVENISGAGTPKPGVTKKDNQ